MLFGQGHTLLDPARECQPLLEHVPGDPDVVLSAPTLAEQELVLEVGDVVLLVTHDAGGPRILQQFGSP